MQIFTSYIISDSLKPGMHHREVYHFIVFKFTLLQIFSLITFKR
jgi:hypothetical protein